MILGLRTDKPEAELYLMRADGTVVEEYRWMAHRALSVTILSEIEDLLNRNNTSREDLTGIVVYQGPGSFTGLRIGIAVANSLSYALQIPIAAAEGEAWLTKTLNELMKLSEPQVITPAYGAEAHITAPKK